jgi:hypothetical protein
MNEEKLCENCQRRRVGPRSSTYCMVCGLSSDDVTDVDVQKSPALDGLNQKLEWRENYIRNLEEENARLRGELHEYHQGMMNQLRGNAKPQ